MKKTITIKVRRDGAFNIRSNNRRRLGIYPGSVLNVEFDDQFKTFTCTPLGYTCSVCERQFDTPTDSFGICTACNDLISQKIKNGSASTIAQAVAEVSKVRKAKVVKK